MPNLTPEQADERAKFEAAYQRRYPNSVALASSHKFARDSFGDYESTTVEVAWQLWNDRASRASTPAEPCPLAKDRNDAARAALIEDCPELNMSNYDQDDVERLNDWAIRASSIIDVLMQDAAPEQPVAQSAPAERKLIEDMLSFADNDWSIPPELLDRARELLAASDGAPLAAPADAGEPSGKLAENDITKAKRIMAAVDAYCENQTSGNRGDLRSVILDQLVAARPSVDADASRPDIIERLSYHQFERDDLMIDECLMVLADGWKRTHGRTERQMVMQILELLAAGAEHTPPIEDDGLDRQARNPEALPDARPKVENRLEKSQGLGRFQEGERGGHSQHRQVGTPHLHSTQGADAPVASEGVLGGALRGAVDRKLSEGRELEARTQAQAAKLEAFARRLTEPQCAKCGDDIYRCPHDAIYCADSVLSTGRQAAEVIEGADAPVAWRRRLERQSGAMYWGYTDSKVFDHDEPLFTRSASPQQAVSADAMDARRYRFLRHADLDALAAANWKDGEVYEGDALDAAIDAALSASPEVSADAMDASEGDQT